MTPKAWRVRLGVLADDDLDDILLASIAKFGATQARAYEQLVIDALSDLEAGPMVLGSTQRDDIGPGFRTLHVSRRGRRGRHVLLYRTAGSRIIEVVRILHDRMNIVQHLPPDAL